MDITFLLNGESVALKDVPPTQTLLDWLREERGLTGTKEGCNEGDCGACTIMVSDGSGHYALNACILFLPQLQGKSIRTVEGVSTSSTDLHPVQQAMITYHGSQCGFCTPGFVMSMTTAHANGTQDYNDQFAGNLCRCTGYAPILRAAKAAQYAPVPNWIATDQAALEQAEAVTAPQPESRPQTADELAEAYANRPEATLVAGATDLGLDVTKKLQTPTPLIFLQDCRDLQTIHCDPFEIRIGAMVTMNTLRTALAKEFPDFAEMLRRFASQQVRNAATLGGNIANGSPIGDCAPALIALDAKMTLRHRNLRRTLPVEDFFLDYGKQDRAPGEFIDSITLPRGAHNLRVYKLSKRFDQDISAVLAAFNIRTEQGVITEARLAFGGMAGIPKRARSTEDALIGHPMTSDTLKKAQIALSHDFTPLSDMRASAQYRIGCAEALLARYFADLSGTATSVLEVTL